MCKYDMKMPLHNVQNDMANTQAYNMEGDTYNGHQINTD
jgi:hypothetical protein